MLAIFAPLDAVQLCCCEPFIDKRFQNKGGRHPDKSARLDDYRRSLPTRQPVKRCAIEQPHYPLAAVRVTSPGHLRHKVASPIFSRETRNGFPNVVKTHRNRLLLICLLRSTPPGPRESTHFFHRSERQKQSPTPSAPTIVMFFSEASESWLSVHPNNAPDSEKCLHPSFEALARRHEIREVRTRVTTVRDIAISSGCGSAW